MDDIEYLKKEKDEAWKRIVGLEEEFKIFKKPLPENVKDIKNSSMAASKYRNRCEESSKKSQEFQDLSEVSLRNIEDNVKTATSNIENIEKISKNCNSINDNILSIYTDIKQKYSETQKTISEIEAIYEDNEELAEKISSLNEHIEQGNQSVENINILHKQATTKRNEIFALHREIMGYDKKDDQTGAEEHITGLKEELEDAYSNLSTDLEDFKSDLENLKTNANSQYETFISEKEESITSTVNKWKDNYAVLKKEIEGLLPGALAAGLSHAYADKKRAERTEIKGYEKVFRKSIGWMIGVSFIPITISVASILFGVSFDTVINRLPFLVIAFLPLYAPILWIACSSDKKIKLAKRLIEEYTHKEVISKTYQGLVKQISDLDGNESSVDLKTKLLYNLVVANSENPGKLITDYNKTDNPLFDALDKSTKLANAVEKLSNIPGFSKIAKTLAQKSDKQQAAKKAIVEAVIDGDMDDNEEQNKES